MIGGQGELDGRPDNHRTVEDSYFVCGRADGENGCLRRVDYGGEMVDTEHPQVADGESPPGELLRGQPAGSGTVDEGVSLERDLAEAFLPRVAG